MNIKNIYKINVLTKVLNLHCHCTGKRPDLTSAAIWIFSSCLTPFRHLFSLAITLVRRQRPMLYVCFPTCCRVVQLVLPVPEDLGEVQKT